MYELDALANTSGIPIGKLALTKISNVLKAICYRQGVYPATVAYPASFTAVGTSAAIPMAQQQSSIQPSPYQQYPIQASPYQQYPVVTTGGTVATGNTSGSFTSFFSKMFGGSWP